MHESPNGRDRVRRSKTLSLLLYAAAYFNAIDVDRVRQQFAGAAIANCGGLVGNPRWIKEARHPELSAKMRPIGGRKEGRKEGTESGKKNGRSDGRMEERGEIRF